MTGSRILRGAFGVAATLAVAWLLLTCALHVTVELVDRAQDVPLSTTDLPAVVAAGAAWCGVAACLWFLACTLRVCVALVRHGPHGARAPGVTGLGLRAAAALLGASTLYGAVGCAPGPTSATPAGSAPAAVTGPALPGAATAVASPAAAAPAGEPGPTAVAAPAAPAPSSGASAPAPASGAPTPSSPTATPSSRTAAAETSATSAPAADPPTVARAGWRPAPRDGSGRSSTLITAPPRRDTGDDRAGDRARAPGSRSDAVTVLRGDTLWSIAAARLGPDADAASIQRAWPAWYEANRDVIGEDPDLLLPGTVLRAPGGG